MEFISSKSKTNRSKPEESDICGKFGKPIEDGAEYFTLEQQLRLHSFTKFCSSNSISISCLVSVHQLSKTILIANLSYFKGKKKKKKRFLPDQSKYSTLILCLVAKKISS